MSCFEEWPQIFGCERLTGALLDRLTHHVHILEMNGESFRLASSKKQNRGTTKIAHKENEREKVASMTSHLQSGSGHKSCDLR